jgi:S-DNA-T family DNA segregation ATPase FtsK/SpoIIIE
MGKSNVSDNRRQRTNISQKEEDLNPFFTPNNIKKGVGIGLLLLSVFMVIGFLSYFFTWKNDQDKVLEFSWRLIFSSKVSVDNTLGSLGALMSHFFFFDLVGVCSFFVAYFTFTLGTNLAFREKIFKLGKIAIHLVFLIILLSTFFAFVFSKSGFPAGGGLGTMIYEWLSTLLGKIGLGILLSTLFVLYLSLFIDFKSIIEGLRKSGGNENDPEWDNLGEKESFDIEIPKESIIPPEKKLPISHFEADDYDLLKADEADDILIDDIIEPELIEEEVLDLPAFKKNKSEPLENVELNIEKGKTDVLLPEIEHPRGSIGTKYDPTLDLEGFEFPSLEILEEHGDGEITINKEELEVNKNQIVETLSNYNIQISKIKATVGPTVTLYEIVPAAGIRISKIKNLEDDIALSLAALGIRIIAPIPGKGTIGIEVPNKKKSVVSMRSLLASEKFVHADMDLPIAMGKTITNENFIMDLAKMPHLLMAGATGQGKSVGLNAILVSLLYKKHPAELKFVLVDPKKVELTLYKRIENHYLAKLPGEEEAIITDTKKVIHTLNALCIEMDQRYDLLKIAQVRQIKEYNVKFTARQLNPQNGHRYLPYIVLVVDEFADLMMTAGKEVETPIARLAQLARAIGIHLVIATQRPSVNIITGTIKANFPGRIAFKVTSKIDSRTILDAGGADQLIGRGDMLLSIGGDMIRLQCPFVDTPEVEKLTEHIEDQPSYSSPFLLPEYIDPNDDSAGKGEFFGEKDELFSEAAKIIVQHQQGSTSLIQRRLKLGYNRAGRLMDQLEAAGVVGPNLGSKAREVYIQTEAELERILLSLE